MTLKRRGWRRNRWTNCVPPINLRLSFKAVFSKYWNSPKNFIISVKLEVATSIKTLIPNYVWFVNPCSILSNSVTFRKENNFLLPNSLTSLLSSDGTFSEWFSTVNFQVERTRLAFIDVLMVTTHPSSWCQCAASWTDVITRWTSQREECVVWNRFNIEIDGTSMRTSVGQTSRLAGSTTREEISVTNWCSNTSSSNPKCWSIGVNTFDVISIVGINTACRITNTEAWTWVQSALVTFSVLSKKNPTCWI